MYRNYIFKYVFAGVFFFVCSFVSFAQEKLEFNIVNFNADPFSTTAQDKRYEKYDGNGDRYAIIKVKDAQGEGDLDGFTFNFGSLNSIVESHDDELWVYVQRNAKTVTIKRPGYKTVERYDLNTTIQPGKTYLMTLTMSRIRKEVVHDITKQVLQFVVTPSNEKAFVKVKNVNKDGDYEPWGAVDETGSLDKILDFGTYDYIITAQDYVQSSGRLVLSDSKTTHVEKVVLKPNFGFLSVTDAHGIAGAQVFVDDQMIGTIPYSDANRRWACGNHTLTITNGDLYKPYKTTFVIEQGETTILSPKLESNFAETTFKVDADADIYIDGVVKGKGTWTGPLKAGKYLITCKQENHRETNKYVTIRPDIAETYLLDAPKPIVGNLYVSTNPSGATITVDGRNVGVTPKIVSDLLIGSHSVRIMLANHKTESKTIEIKEGQTEELSVTMSDMARMTITSDPDDANLFINGKAVGKTPYTADMASGDYEIRISKPKYKDYIRKEHLDSSNPQVKYILVRQYFQKNGFYFNPSLQVGSCMAMGAGIGGYVCNVNVEASYMLGLSSSEEIYWNAMDKDERPVGYTYKVSVIGGRVGYGVVCGSRLRVTPQIGAGCVQYNGTEGVSGTSSFKPEKFYAVNATIGCKVDYAIMPLLGVFITPEFSTAVTKSDYFKEIEPVSTKIKGFATGVNIRAGLSLFF